MICLYMLDLDGLLIDTEKFHYLAYCQMCASEGADLPWSFSQFLRFAHAFEGGLEKAIYCALPQLIDRKKTWRDLYEKKQSFLEQILKTDQIDCMPGAIELLQWLGRKKVPFCAVTNSRRRHVELLCARCRPLQLIPKWWAREDYADPKPSPSGYLAAINSYGVLAHQAYGFEDSPKGLNALLTAGAEGAFIKKGDLAFSKKQPFQSKRWKRYSSLTDWLTQHDQTSPTE